MGHTCWGQVGIDDFVFDAFKAFPNLSEIEINMDRIRRPALPIPMLLLAPCSRRLQSVVLGGARMKDFRLTEQEKQEITVASPLFASDIKEFRLHLSSQYDADDLFHDGKDCLIWFLSQLTKLESLEFSPNSGFIVTERLRWTTVQLVHLQHLTISSSRMSFESLQSLLFANKGILRTLTLKNIILLSGRWSAVFDELRNSYPLIDDLANVKSLVYANMLPGIWHQGDVESWRLLCECVNLRRKQKGLPVDPLPFRAAGIAPRTAKRRSFRNFP
jgi:hypothetical protein